MIYLDNAATTKPLDSFIVDAAELLHHHWYNPSAVYKPAVDVKKMVADTRSRAESMLKGGYRCTFTSCGTESAYLAIWGSLPENLSGKRVITSSVEHPCVYQNALRLKKAGADVVFAKVDRHGRLDEQAFVRLLTPNTVLVSIMHVNNITGAVNPINRLYNMTKGVCPSAVFHCDGVQGFMKIAPPSCDLYTASAHKINGLKGTGLLFVKNGLKFHGSLPGGGQENGVRSGTENTFGICALDHAMRFWQKLGQANHANMENCRSRLLAHLQPLDDFVVHSPEDGAVHILNISVLGVGGEIMLHSLESDGIYLSTGSACSARKKDDRIGDALGLSKAEKDSQIRLSFAHDTNPDDMETVARKIIEVATRHRKLMRSR